MVVYYCGFLPRWLNINDKSVTQWWIVAEVFLQLSIPIWICLYRWYLYGSSRKMSASFCSPGRPEVRTHSPTTWAIYSIILLPYKLQVIIITHLVSKIVWLWLCRCQCSPLSRWRSCRPVWPNSCIFR